MKGKLKEIVDEINFDQFTDELKQNCSNDGQSEIIFMIKKDDVIYVGNKQINNFIGEYEDDKFDEMQYWFAGSCSQFQILHTYRGVANTKMANQKLLNEIKQIAVNKLGAKWNVQQAPEGLDLFEQFGKTKSNWKAITTTFFNNTDILEIRSMMQHICYIINRDNEKWYWSLCFKNRFWFISQDSSDIKQRNELIPDYDNKLTEEEKILLVMMKDYITYLLWHYGSIQKKEKTAGREISFRIANSTYYNDRLRQQVAKHPFSNGSSIRLFLAMLYKKSSYDNISQYAEHFYDWYNKIIKM